MSGEDFQILHTPVNAAAMREIGETDAKTIARRYWHSKGLRNSYSVWEQTAKYLGNDSDCEHIDKPRSEKGESPGMSLWLPGFELCPLDWFVSKLTFYLIPCSPPPSEIISSISLFIRLHLPFAQFPPLSSLRESYMVTFWTRSRVKTKINESPTVSGIWG